MSCCIKYFTTNEFLCHGSRWELDWTRDPFWFKILLLIICKWPLLYIMGYQWIFKYIPKREQLKCSQAHTEYTTIVVYYDIVVYYEQINNLLKKQVDFGLRLLMKTTVNFRVFLWNRRKTLQEYLKIKKNCELARLRNRKPEVTLTIAQLPVRGKVSPNTKF